SAGGPGFIGGTSGATALLPEAVGQAQIQAKANALGAAGIGPPVTRGLEHVGGVGKGGGFCIRYQDYDIYYSPSTGAHDVHGGIRDKYNYLNGPSNRGLPTTDELNTPDGTGRYNEFSGDAFINWSKHTGPMMVRGSIHQVWVAKGAEGGEAGHPTSDE